MALLYGAQWHDVRGIIRIDEGDGGDRSGLDHRAPRPGEHYTYTPAKGLRQEVILAPGVGVRAAKFGVTQRTDQHHHSAEQPRADEHHFAADARCDERGQSEDTDADDDPDDEGHTIPNRKGLTRATRLLVRTCLEPCLWWDDGRGARLVCLGWGALDRVSVGSA